MLTPEFGRFGRTRLDWLGQIAQKVIWTLPLDSSHRVDQDPYI
jgi:hypothetical protein